MTPRQAEDLLNAMEDRLRNHYGVMKSFNSTTTKELTDDQRKEAELLYNDYFKLLSEW